jgi:photosystem II stability/assembly factor-like uncharacterized protein
VLALVLTISGAAEARTSQQAVPTSIAFWDRAHGLAGFAVYGPTGRSEGYISTTSDGGRSWTVRWRGTAVWDVTVVRRSRDARAHVGRARPCPGCPTLMLRTSDRGKTWRPAGTAPSMPSFPTRHVGFAMRSRDTNAGDLMKTTDSGRTWRRVGSPCRRGWGGFAWDAAISFVSPSRGWVLCKGPPGTGSQSKALYLTTDGGSRWTQLVNAHFEPGRVRLRGLQARGYPEGMTFTRRGRGLLWSARGHTLRTRNGGRSWLPLSVTLPKEREGYSGWLVSNRVAFLLLQDNSSRRRWSLLRSTDGSRSWQRVQSWPLR